jgi:sporulation integral membrane protein YlbJ
MSIKPTRTEASRPANRWTAAIGIGAAVLLVCGLALAMPGTVLEASIRGLSIWWEVLFPALFPFFVLSELLLGFGVVHMAGTLLDPLMRPLFRIPGLGGFVLAMGTVSGYPVGARITSRLMEQGLVSRSEGERLVAMTTTSDPIFLIGAVCTGFFGRPGIAAVLAAAHYGGAIGLGLLLRWTVPKAAAERGQAKPAGGRLRLALQAMHRARLADGRPFAQMLEQALRSSLQLMIVVGGLVVFFSAGLEVLTASGLLDLLRDAFGWLLHRFGLARELSVALVQGTFEVTLGARAASGAGLLGTLPSLQDRVAAAAFVLSWAGLSVHAQVAGLMSRTSWRYGPFLRARLLHALLAVLLVYALWPVLYRG